MFFRKIFSAETVARLVILQTLVVVALVVPATWLIASSFSSYFGVAQGREQQAVVRFVTWLSLGETIAFCPLLFAPVAAALRRLSRAQAQLEQLADTDALTGLLNRRGLERAAARLMACARERDGVVAALICDIDHFKRVNDLHGHGAGDRTLRALGDLLNERFASDSAAVARIGGEEFLALVVVRNPRAGERAADELRRAFAEREIQAGSVVLRCTVSVGVATAAAPCAIDPLVERADAALYRAKAGGRNRIASAAA